MNFTVEGILIATLLILPGFLASSVQRLFIEEKGSEAQWIAVSALRSLGLNAVTSFALTFAVKLIAWDSLVRDFTDQLKLLTVKQVGFYIVILYVMAAIYGLVMGLLWKYGRGIAFASGWTPVSPYDDVWTDALDSVFGTKDNRSLSGHPEQKRPWIYIHLDDDTELLGRLSRSSVRIEQDKPFEIYLESVHTRDRGGSWHPVEAPDGTEAVGMHMRIEPKTPVFFLSAPSAWRPSRVNRSQQTATQSKTGTTRKEFFLVWHEHVPGDPS